MRPDQYLEGVLRLAAIVVPTAYLAWRIRRALLPLWSGAPARLAESILGLSLLVVGAELAGLLGLFRWWAVVIASCGVGLASAYWLTRRLPAAIEGQTAPTSIPTGRADTPFVALAVAIVVATWAVRMAGVLDHGMRNFDTVWYHLPEAARFTQVHSIAHLHFTSEWPLSAFLAANAELFHALGMLAFGYDILSPFINLGWLALCLLAAWCIGRPVGLGGLTLVAAAIAMTAPVVVSNHSGQAVNDVAAASLFVSAIAIVVNSDRGWRVFLVGGLAAGLAVGTKLTTAAPLAILTVGLLVRTPRDERRSVLVAWTTGLVTTGSFWYVRNLVATANPVPGVRIGIANFRLPTPFDLTKNRGFAGTVADYLTDTHTWAAVFRPGLSTALGAAWFLILGATLAGIAVGLVRASPPRGRLLGLVCAVAVISYVVTPGTAPGIPPAAFLFGVNVRYLLPALVLGPVLCGLALAGETATRRRLVMAAVAAVLLIEAAPFAFAQVLLLADALMGMAAFAVVAHRRAARRWRSRDVSRIAVAGGLALVILLGWPIQRHYLQRRYLIRARDNATQPLSADWARHVHGARIAVVGSELQYPLYGRDLSNWVDYVGHRGRLGAFRPTRSCQEWRAALQRGRYRFVVIAPRGPPAGRLIPPEMGWTRSAPGVEQIIDAPAEWVFRVDRPVDATGCS
jgi:hypothetical protein